LTVRGGLYRRQPRSELCGR